MLTSVRINFFHFFHTNCSKHFSPSFSFVHDFYTRQAWKREARKREAEKEVETPKEMVTGKGCVYFFKPIMSLNANV